MQRDDKLHIGEDNPVHRHESHTTTEELPQQRNHQLQTSGQLQAVISGNPGTGPIPMVILPGANADYNLDQSGTSSNVPSLPPTGSQAVPASVAGLRISAPNVNISPSGATVHHHGDSQARGMSSSPRTNPQQHIVIMTSPASGNTSNTNLAAAAAANRVLLESKPNLSSAFPHLSALAMQGGLGPSPKKRIKLEDKPPEQEDQVTSLRQQVVRYKEEALCEIKENYNECLTELFFLKSGLNMMDYFTWKKVPVLGLTTFLKSASLDKEEEVQGEEREINNEVKVITTHGSSVPLATPVAISTTLPPSVAALNQQGQETRRQGGRHGMVFGHVSLGSSVISQASSLPNGSKSLLPDTTSTSSVVVPASLGSPLPSSSSWSSSRPTDKSGTLPSSTASGTAMPQLQSHLMTKSVTDLRSTPSSGASRASASAASNAVSSAVARMNKSPPISPSTNLNARRQVSEVYEGTMGTQEAIVERAKQEAQVMQRVAELRKEGLWSSRRLPKVQEPPRNKSHWDYLLEEMHWLAADFVNERKWKKAAARKVAKMVSKHFQELEQKEVRAEKEEAQKLKRISGQMARIVKEFWSNIEKVVQYKHQTRLEEKRKKALDLHLNFIVDQTEKYSTWLTEGLQKGSVGGSSVGSASVTPEHSDAGDDEFEPDQDETDDEETIEKAEEDLNENETQEELAALQQEGEVPIEELINSLPQEVLDGPADLEPPDKAEDEEADDEKEEEDDEEFKASKEDEADIEDSIAEQEKVEKKSDYNRELKDLQDEGEMDIDELYKRYAGAYDSDFEMPPEESDGTEDDEEEDDDDAEEEEEEEEGEEEEVDEEEGLKALMEAADVDKNSQGDAEESGPGKEITDIAAEALSLQPKGYTLQTTEVKTGIPFLLKHSLREYQHVGLDWLATMYEKRLNGILADEMGLGKTIQTIALLAHLVCEKGIWGPHLIVVPTSVMLNWEMELKKWCPAFKILTYYGTQKERKLKRQGWTKTNAFHVCITSYKLVIQDHQSFRRKKWKYLILDEAQNIKNFKSQRWQTLLNFSSQRRLLLTGTPLQNSLMELWSLMHFLMPNVFQSHREFKEWFANPLTGMIEGSHEYNESLIRRLHKVLRPFLLRRLKSDVEKQMPKKYEHVVMCPLSKRQRFLYDDFMSKTKTKETLATGHFMSVINILMQLRKVCNHPSLFDPRPIVSPFQMEGIVYNTASLVLRAIEYRPLEMVDLYSVFPSLVDLERDLPAFVAHRVHKLQMTRPLIEEIDAQGSEKEQLPVGKLKNMDVLNKLIPVSMAEKPSKESVSQITVSRTNTDSVTTNSVVPRVSSATRLETLTQVATSATGTIQQATPKIQTTSLGQGVSSSSPITVQIQHTEQGARLMIPAGQLSQLPPGLIQIVQTSLGQQVVASPSLQGTGQATTVVAVSSSALVSTASVTGTPITTVSVIGNGSTVVTSSSTDAKPTPVVVETTQKPVMRVAPFNEAAQARQTRMTNKRTLEEKKKKSEFFLDEVWQRRHNEHLNKLDYISRINQKNCGHQPLYGQDLREAVDVYRDWDVANGNSWRGLGAVHCHHALTCGDRALTKALWGATQALRKALHTPVEYLQQMEEILSRYVFNTPKVAAPRISFRVSHPPPSQALAERRLEFLMQKELSPLATCLHPISTKMQVQFPELRLIQYDCGKLQTLDLLLRRLNSGHHRVLLFTQMTKMLDILEAFLNYHGYRYLRLDGTTKVEQRQILMDRFNADKRIFVFILSTRSGGIGVNLTGADTVVFYDSDWNPTMDAQAQDRCHRIGQTRDVHIYRLISERTVEENILKKANQKRMLGDMAIEGGNFTTAFFKEQTIKELFSEPSGLDSLVKEKQQQQEEEEERLTKQQEVAPPAPPPPSNQGGGDEGEKPSKPLKPSASEDKLMAQFEQALGQAEDETDAKAVEVVKAEQKAELVEFDENIPWDEKEAELRKEEEEFSKAEQELAMLEKELSPIERYAVNFVEYEYEPPEDLAIAEEDIEMSKKEWELSRLKALKEEEERRMEMEEDEMLYTYPREDAYNQVFLCDESGEKMPIWAPPTPPHDDNDIYVDQCVCFLYEPSIMPESQLPPIYVKKEHKKPKVESITTRKQKARKEEQPRVPRSLFDRPQVRREAKAKQGGLLKPYRAVQPMPSKAVEPDNPDWLIHEDWALLQAVQNLFDVPLNLTAVSPAHLPNWDLVSDVVSSISRVYRSAKQCKNRYENVVIPREEGRIMYDINPKKQSKKTKGIYKTKNNRPMKTSQLYAQDCNNAVTMLYTLRFDSVKSLASKRPPVSKQTLAPSNPKNPKHAQVLSESNINYDTPLDPVKVAEIRAQRIQREKKQNQAAAAAAQAQTDLQRSQQQTAAQGTQQMAVSVNPSSQVTTIAASLALQTGLTPGAQVAAQLQPLASAVTTTVMTGSSVAKAVIGQAVSLTRPATIGATGNIVVNNPTGASLAAINRSMNLRQAASGVTAVTMTGTISQAARPQRSLPTSLTIQEISSVAASQAGTPIGQARPQQTTSLTNVQLAKLASTQGVTTTVSATGQPLATKLTPQAQTILLQKQIKTQQQQQQHQLLLRKQQQQQQPRQVLDPVQVQQAQLRRIPGQAAGVQKTVIAQQIVSSLAQVVVPKQPLKTTALARPVTPKGAQVQVLAQSPVGTSQLQHNLQIPSSHGTQILAQVQCPVGQPATVTSGVKTVSAAQGAAVQITHVPQQQQKAAVGKTAVNQIKPQMLISQRKPGPQQKLALTQPMGKMAMNTVQIIQPGQPGQNVTYQLQPLKRNTSGGMLIATVTQSQAPGAQPLIHKVISTSATPLTHLQAITTVNTASTSAAIVASSAPQIASISMPLSIPPAAAKSPAIVTATSVGGQEVGSGQQVQHPVLTKVQSVVPTAAGSSIGVHQIQVTPASIHQAPPNVVVSTVTSPHTVLVSNSPSAQSPALAATILQQGTNSPIPSQQTPAGQVTIVTTSGANPTSLQQSNAVVTAPVGNQTVSSQAALAAASALPQGAQVAVTGAQAQQQGSKAAPYAMRTRNQPKH